MIQIRQWYDSKDQADARMAGEWLKENCLEIKDGKIIKKKNCICHNIPKISYLDKYFGQFAFAVRR